MIRFEKVWKSFGSKKILKDFSFEANEGEILFILGRSGMGKSVTLKQIVGLLKPDQGKVFVGPYEVSSMNEKELEPVRKICGMVFQHPALLDSLTVSENVGFGLKSENMRSDERQSRILSALKTVHLGEDVLDRYPPDISYGMQKRVSLARTLITRPKTLLFDEPTTGLDPITTGVVNDLIFELSRKLNTTSLVVSHDMASALKVADRILVLDQGEVLALGTPEEIRGSKITLVQEFLAEELSQEEAQ